MIVVGTITADHRFPSASNLICHKSGATNAWGFDVSAAWHVLAIKFGVRTC